MTKKHFIDLANRMRELEDQYALYAEDIANEEGGECNIRYLPLVEVRRMLTAFCKAHNPAFKRTLWLEYLSGRCGPSGGRIRGFGGCGGKLK
jgi:hypothetical protein